jgi:4'-phosphopantetheinyl transferase
VKITGTVSVMKKNMGQHNTNTTLVSPLALKRENASFKAVFVISNLTLEDLLIKNDFLHLNEQMYYESLVVDKRRFSYLIGRYAAKKAIVAYDNINDMTSIEIIPGIFQQPVVRYFNNQNVQVSISHSQHWGAALAFPEAHPMSIDIEDINPERKIHTLLQTSIHEQKKLDNIPMGETEKYTLIWTIKEALSKILRTGLTTEFSVFEISDMVPWENYFECYFRHFTQYKSLSFFFQNSALSVIVPKKSDFDIKMLRDDLNRTWGNA